MPGFLRHITSPSARAIAALSAFALLLSAGRVAYTGRRTFLFMAWNLLLALIPWLLAVLAEARQVRRRLAILGLVACWLVFFPNAPYMLTDLLHLGKDAAVPRWYDLVMLLAYGFAGLISGFCSLQLIESCLRRGFGLRRVWPLSVFLIYLSCFGIYLGRFLRWNSWDLLTNLDDLVGDIVPRLANPLAYPTTWTFTLLFGTLLALVYASLKSFRPFVPDGGGQAR